MQYPLYKLRATDLFLSLLAGSQARCGGCQCSAPGGQHPWVWSGWGWLEEGAGFGGWRQGREWSCWTRPGTVPGLAGEEGGVSLLLFRLWTSWGSCWASRPLLISVLFSWQIDDFRADFCTFFFDKGRLAPRLFMSNVSEGQPEMKPGGITKHVVYLQVRLKSIMI